MNLYACVCVCVCVLSCVRVCVCMYVCIHNAVVRIPHPTTLHYVTFEWWPHICFVYIVLFRRTSTSYFIDHRKNDDRMTQGSVRIMKAV